MTKRLFHLTTDKSKEGYIYGYNDGLLCSLEILEKLDFSTLSLVYKNLKLTQDDFIEWCTNLKLNVVELHQQKITFDLFWNKYDDKLRSSKKRSQKLWDKLPETEQSKAFYYHDTYNKHRGNAEKKYCETYLGAELWNN